MIKWEKLREQLSNQIQIAEGEIRANIHAEEFMDAALLKSDIETYELVLLWMEALDQAEATLN